MNNVNYRKNIRIIKSFYYPDSNFRTLILLFDIIILNTELKLLSLSPSLLHCYMNSEPRQANNNKWNCDGVTLKLKFKKSLLPYFTLLSQLQVVTYTPSWQSNSDICIITDIPNFFFLIKSIFKLYLYLKPPFNYVNM